MNLKQILLMGLVLLGGDVPNHWESVQSSVNYHELVLFCENLCPLRLNFTFWLKGGGVCLQKYEQQQKSGNE